MTKLVRNFIAFRDYETGSKNRYKTQPLQLACVMIDINKLEIVPNSLFHSKIKPLPDDAAIAIDLDPVSDEALAINKLKREDLEKAPDVETVWKQYCTYLKKYNLKGNKGGKWDAPIVAGFNNRGFDDEIDIRLMKAYGPEFDEWGGWSLYHPIHNFDLKEDVTRWFHFTDMKSISMDSLRDKFGLSTEKAHDAVTDVTQGAHVLIHFLKMYRTLEPKIKFDGAFSGKGL